MADLIDPTIVFAEPDHGSCCDCCEGYCPKWEGDMGDGLGWPLASLTVSGVEYLGLRTCIIRRDMLADLPEKAAERVEPVSKADLAWAIIPARRPPFDERPQSAELLDRLERVGVTRHAGGSVVHLYAGDAHIGWCKWSQSRAGASLDDLPLIRAIAKECGITLNAAARAHSLAHGGAA